MNAVDSPEKQTILVIDDEPINRGLDIRRKNS